jgi:hypothetical protein
MPLPKVLIGITTCWSMNFKISDDGIWADWWETVRCTDPAARRAACRATWIKDIKSADYKFFFGSPIARVFRPEYKNRTIEYAQTPPLQPDEVKLPCGDMYRDNSNKVQEMCRWALDHGYDFLIRIDDDSYLYPERLLATDFYDYDYSGSNGGGQVWYASGSSLCLSRKAMEIIVNTKVTHWADDVWIGHLLIEDHQIPLHIIDSFYIKYDQEYIIKPEEIPLDHQYVMLHSCFPDVMKIFYERDHATT